jgi:hypothetical protein
MSKETKEMRCPEHPEFDPRNQSQWSDLTKNYQRCSVCHGLHYGLLPIGHHNGEYKLDSNEEDLAKIKIGPMAIDQFGYVRGMLASSYSRDDGPMWFVDQETMTIYLRGADRSLIRDIKKRLGCVVYVRVWKKR